MSFHWPHLRTCGAAAQRCAWAHARNFIRRAAALRRASTNWANIWRSCNSRCERRAPVARGTVLPRQRPAAPTDRVNIIQRTATTFEPMSKRGGFYIDISKAGHIAPPTALHCEKCRQLRPGYKQRQIRHLSSRWVEATITCSFADGTTHAARFRATCVNDL
jgi:hypothetical protein